MPTSFQSFNPGDLIEDSHVEQFIEPIQNLESGKPWFGEDIGATNAFEVDLDPAPAAYTEGMLVHFMAANDVTGASTLELNGLGPIALVKEGNASLISGDIVEDQMVSAVYDGTSFHVISQVMNPTVTAAAPTENTLVYAEVTKDNTSSATNLTLPSFTFSSSKSYLMEVSINGSSSNAVRVTLDDGTTSYAYPSALTTMRVRDYYQGRYYQKLPTLNGLHTVNVNAAYVYGVSVKIWEINDNLVYAVLTPPNLSSVATASLAGFTATSGHVYELRVICNGYSGAPGFAAYLTNGGGSVGLPASGPTSDLTFGGYYSDSTQASAVLTGLSGSYTVTARGQSHTGINVLIYDIT